MTFLSLSIPDFSHSCTPHTNSFLIPCPTHGSLHPLFHYPLGSKMFHSHVIKFHSYTILHSIHSMPHFHKISIPSILLSSLVPRLSWNANMYRGENLVSLLCKHDVIKIRLNRKTTFCVLFNQLCVQRSACDIRPQIARYVQ